MATPVVNPDTFTITDPTLQADQVTSMNVKFGTKSGTYTLVANVPVSSPSSGVITGKVADLHQQLAQGTWFSACSAVSAAGESANGPETSFVIQAIPAPPTISFSHA